MKHRRTYECKRTGFTLLEFFIALAIVCAIAAIVWPALSASRERARSAQCQSNSRQLALAIQQYAQDNEGAYPRVLTTEYRNGQKFPVFWQDLIYPYVRDARVFHCPDHPADDPETVDPAHVMTDMAAIDYTYDALKFNVFTRFPTKTMQGARESIIGTPAAAWLTTDSGWITDDGVYHYCRKVSKTSCGRSFIGGTRHAGGANYSFADGHVSWLTPEAMGEIDCLNGPPPTFTTSGNAR